MIVDFGQLEPRERYFWMISTIVPRPIAWVSTVSPEGALNLAPFSYFNGVTGDPPVVSISVGSRKGEPKDTARNAMATKELVVNIVPAGLGRQMVQTSADYAYGVSEFEKAGLTPEPSRLVKPPRVKEAPVAMDCRLYDTVAIGKNTLILAEILLLHADDRVMKDGYPDPEKLQPLGRLGGDLYGTLGEVVRHERPSI